METNPYQNSLNLPKTAFPMKANLSQKEPVQIQNWEKNNVYDLIQKKNADAVEFVMPDGPPYANGNIHIGHCLNKLLKDFAIKYQAMQGRSAPFIPGWDCHGLPIEHAVNKELGPKRKEKSEGELRALCRSYAEKFVDLQRDQFKRLGILADWDHPYKTMDSSYEASMIRALGKIYDQGFVYRGEKPVHWCWSCGTALAEAEVEYENRKDPSIFVKFEIKDGLDVLGQPKGKTFVVIWTTTPWSLPANLAVCVHPDFDYGLYKVTSSSLEAEENWIIATELEGGVAQGTDTELELLKTFKGRQIAFGEGAKCSYDDKGLNFSFSLSGASKGLLYEHPLIKQRKAPLLLGTHVTLDAGSGCVHTAPAHGVEDYQVCKSYGISALNPVDDWGRYTDLFAEMKGVKVFDASPKIVEALKNNRMLAGYEDIDHSYAHCWRCHNPVIYRSTSQWFITMDETSKSENTETLRARALREVKYVRWIPAWGQNRITAMIENRPDWCISRQRLWGVPIPVFYCTSCGQAETSSKLMFSVADAVEKSGLEVWHSSELRDFLPEVKGCSKCGGGEFRRGRDILDVWFDSGVCHEAVQNNRYRSGNPADLYLEGSDQHRGWFQSSLLTGVAINNKSPFKTVITHGFVNDSQGRKMSKSLGNVVDPHKLIEKSGAEILRLWTAYEDYSNDLQAGQESFDRVAESYRRVRNTCRYILGNLFDFDPHKDSLPFEELSALDKWALGKNHDFLLEVKKGYESYEYHRIYHALQNYCTVDLSAIYLDILKDRLYTFKASGKERRSAQTVIYQIIKNMITALAPILSFLAEEVYAELPGPKKQSVFLEPFPIASDKTSIEAPWRNAGIDSEWARIFEIRSLIQKALEEARQAKTIGASLEAKVNLALPREDLDMLGAYKSELPSLFIVSQVKLTESAGIIISIERAEGEKCVRCWNYSPDTGANSHFPGACPKCVKALT